MLPSAGGRVAAVCIEAANMSAEAAHVCKVIAGQSARSRSIDHEPCKSL